MELEEIKIQLPRARLCGAGAPARERPAAFVLQRREMIVKYLVRPLFRFAIPTMIFQDAHQIRRKRPRIAGGDVAPNVIRFSHSNDGGADVWI